MLKELKELLQVLNSLKEDQWSSLVFNNIENKIVSLESAIEILEERRKQSEQ